MGLFDNFALAPSVLLDIGVFLLHIGDLGHFGLCFLDRSSLSDDFLGVCLNLRFSLFFDCCQFLHLSLESVFLLLLSLMLSLFDFLSGLGRSFGCD